MSKIRILLADDHAVLRAGLRKLLDSEPDMEVVGEAADGEEALRKTQELTPDIVLMDITMPAMGGLEVTQRIRENSPAIKVLMLTVHDDEGYFHKALRSGAAGYVPKKAADTELFSAIRAAYKGEVFVHPSMTRPLVNELLGAEAVKEAQNHRHRLSKREEEVLRLIAMGHTNQQIADKLFLSVKTVETYKARLMEKLELRGRAELVRYAIQQGLLDIKA
jgi:two-component system response regulator NreC